MTAPSLVREYPPDGGRRVHYILYIVGLALSGWKHKRNSADLPATSIEETQQQDVSTHHRAQRRERWGQQAVGVYVHVCVRACLSTRVWTNQLSSAVGPLLALGHEVYDRVAETRFDNHYGKAKQLKKRALQINGWRAAFSVTLPALGGKAPFFTSDLTCINHTATGGETRSCFYTLC